MVKTNSDAQTDAQSAKEEDALPFVAPSNKLEATASLRWLKKGLADFRQAPFFSLTYGLIMSVITFLIAYLGYQVGSFTMVIILMAGFMFISPAMAMGLYTLSCQIEKGIPPRMLACLNQGKSRLGNQMIFAFALLIVFLIWARAATMMNIFMPMSSEPSISDFTLFFGIGSLVGAVFAIIIFCASAFALPMMLDRDVDAITAMLTSVNAVLSNKPAMLLWASIIVFAVLLGFLTFLIGLAILLPIIGHATWHGYRETIIADAWPQDPIVSD